MRGWRSALVIGLAAALWGCAIYGVPKEQWDAMSEAERVAAMEAHAARENAQAAREQAAKRRIELAPLESCRGRRGFERPDASRFFVEKDRGIDIAPAIRIHLSGKVRTERGLERFAAASAQLSDGQSGVVELNTLDCEQPWRITLPWSYSQGVLRIDGERFGWTARWRKTAREEIRTPRLVGTLHIQSY